MSLNLHAEVRGAIGDVNADVTGYWYVNKGPVQNAYTTRLDACYDLPVEMQCQVQPPSGRDLKFVNLLELQGVIRTVYMFMNPGGINRVNQKGNDLLLFPQWPDAPNDTWKVTIPHETWGVPQNGWSKVLAVLQTDRIYSVLDGNGLLILDDQGRIVRSK